MAQIGPFINTKWGLGKKDSKTGKVLEPYNAKCSFKVLKDIKDSNGTIIVKKGTYVDCWAGCTAVALALIMAYYGRDGIDKINPDGNGVSKIKYKRGCCKITQYLYTANYTQDIPTGKYMYNNVTYPCYYELLDLPAVYEFDYDHMPDTLTINSSALEIEAVTQLILYCGRVLLSYYGNQGTKKGYTVGTLAWHNSYSMPRIKFKDIMYMKESNNPTLFKETVKAEIITYKRPLIMNGAEDDNGTGGHSFICDGYDTSTDKFHFNWGYSGEGDGWYKLDNLVFRVGSNIHNKSYDKAIVYGLYPEFMMGDCTDLDITKDTGNVIKQGDDCISIEDALVMATNMLTNPNYEIQLKVTRNRDPKNGLITGNYYYENYKRDLPFIKCDLDYDYVVTNNDLKLILNKALRKKLF